MFPFSHEPRIHHDQNFPGMFHSGKGRSSAGIRHTRIDSQKGGVHFSRVVYDFIGLHLDYSLARLSQYSGPVIRDSAIRLLLSAVAPI